MSLKRQILRLALPVAALVAGAGWSDVAKAGVKDTSSQEATCKDIGFRPRTVAFADCVMELINRSEGQSDTASYQSVRPMKRRRQQPSPPQPTAVVLTPDEQTCVNYGFRRGTTSFATCTSQIDQAKQQAQLADRQYQLQLQQYQQQLAAYEAQQEVIKKERDRRKWGALAAFGFGMAGSSSPTFGGGMADGLRAMNGQPPLAPPARPQAPVSQNYTVRLPNGNQVYCNYNSMSGYMSCN